MFCYENYRQRHSSNIKLVSIDVMKPYLIFLPGKVQIKLTTHSIGPQNNPN